MIVFSSSCAVYGAPLTSPIAEQTPMAPINPYGRTKTIVEQVLSDYQAAYGLAFAALRYFNASGADPDAEIGECHDPETHLIPRILMAAAETIPFVEILGEDHPTPDGTAIRDYVHVTDLVEAHVAALGQLQGGANRIVLNLGTGVGRSVREIINAAARVTSHEIPVVVGPRRLGDPSMLVADPAASMSAFGFSPRLSDIDTILRTAWPFFAR